MILNITVRLALSELALGDSPRQAVGTMDSYLLVVSGVNPRWGDQSESAVVVRSGPVRWARGTTAQPHQNQGIWEMRTIRLLLIRLALGPRSWSCITSGSGVALGRRQDTPELAYGLGSHRARCGEAVVNR